MNSVPKGRHRRRSGAVGVIVWGGLVLLSAAIAVGAVWFLIHLAVSWWSL